MFGFAPYASSLDGLELLNPTLLVNSCDVLMLIIDCYWIQLLLCLSISLPHFQLCFFNLPGPGKACIGGHVRCFPAGSFNAQPEFKTENGEFRAEGWGCRSPKPQVLNFRFQSLHKL